MSDSTGASDRQRPADTVGPVRRRVRALITRGFCWLAVHAVLRLRVEGLERLPPRPVLLCFNHLNWADPLILLAALPLRIPIALFGPKEEDMGIGRRNRLMAWTGLAVPYKPGKNDLLDTTRRVQAVFDAGASLGIAGEGRIHAGERQVLPLNEGAAYFALRAKVPIVPVAINGTSWLGFGRRVRIRVGDPIESGGRPTRDAVAALTQRTWSALAAIVADAPEPGPPGPFGRWLTELFNEWPEGHRPDFPTGQSEAASHAPAPATPERSGILSGDPTD